VDTLLSGNLFFIAIPIPIRFEPSHFYFSILLGKLCSSWEVVFQCGLNITFQDVSTIMILFVFVFWSSAKKSESFFASQILKTEVVAIICYSASSKLKISGPKKF